MSKIDKKNVKKVLIFILICFVLFMIYEIIDIYAVFQSEVIGDVEFKNGAWNIYINGTDITKGVMATFVIDQINTEENEHTLPGKLAPGGRGTFEIVIDPTDTDVSIKYDVSINTEGITNKNVNIISINETETGNGLIRTGENTYTGIISLSEIDEGKTNKINVEIEWTDDRNK